MIRNLRPAALRLLTASFFLLPASSAVASFHLFVINEIYSDASGNVQFIELTTTEPRQQFLAGITLTATQGVSTNNFTFPTNLADYSGTRSVLIATQGFASLGIVTPDYILPNGFLFLPGGTINYGGVDLVTYAPLPTDGTHSVDRTGTVMVNSPTNFAQQTGSINVPPPTQAGPLDVDGDGHVTALTDGLMILRYLFGLRGDSLTLGAMGQGAARNTSALIEAYIGTLLPP